MGHQAREHHVREQDVAVSSEAVSRNHVPARVPVMGLATLCGLDCGLNLKADSRDGTPGWGGLAIRLNQVRVLLMMVVLERRALMHRVRQQVANQAGEVVALNDFMQPKPDVLAHVLVHDVHCVLAMVQSLGQLVMRQRPRQGHLAAQKRRVDARGMRRFQRGIGSADEGAEGHAQSRSNALNVPQEAACCAGLDGFQLSERDADPVRELLLCD